jgi:hypothetical protein
MLRKPSTRSAYIIIGSGAAAVLEVLSHTKTVSARNLQFVLPLEFNLSELKVQYRSTSMALEYSENIFRHTTKASLEKLADSLRILISVLSRNANCPKFYLILLNH